MADSRCMAARPQQEELDKGTCSFFCSLRVTGRSQAARAVLRAAPRRHCIGIFKFCQCRGRGRADRQQSSFRASDISPRRSAENHRTFTVTVTRTTTILGGPQALRSRAPPAGPPAMRRNARRRTGITDFCGRRYTQAGQLNLKLCLLFET